jgi:biotin transport system substrate-specific component
MSAPEDQTAAVLPAPVARTSVSTDIALVASFAAFIAVCAILPGIPTPSGVPITLQTFGVILAGLVLGWRRGGLAALLYVALGLAGLPIFAEGTGGLVVLSKPSVGYLLAFPFAAALAGALGGLALRLAPRLQASAFAARLGEWAVRTTSAWRYPLLVLAGLGASFLTIHPAGIVGLMARLGLSFQEALAIDVVYWPGDVIKNLAAAAVAVAIFKAFPDMLRTRR